MIFEKIKYFPTNWEDGMKLTSDHFSHLEESIEDGLRDGRAIAAFALNGYGLLPNSQFILQNAQGQSPQSVRVILNTCRAILPGGYRVEVLPENVQKLKIPSEMPFVEFVPDAGVRYHIFLSVDKDNRVSAGIPETRPIRQPHVCPDYQLECIPHSKAKSAMQMSANKMKLAEYLDGKLIEAYIPACLSINGYPLLEKWYQFFQNQLENVVRISTQVMNDQRKKDPAKTEFCGALVNYIRGTRATFKWVIPNQSPIHLVTYFGDLASLTEGLIETSDRDFIRNSMKNGQINDLSPNIQELLKYHALSQEDMANYILRVKRFTDSLISTLQTFVVSKPPKPRAGERNISSG